MHQYIWNTTKLLSTSTKYTQKQAWNVTKEETTEDFLKLYTEISLKTTKTAETILHCHKTTSKQFLQICTERILYSHKNSKATAQKQVSIITRQLVSNSYKYGQQEFCIAIKTAKPLHRDKSVLLQTNKTTEDFLKLCTEKSLQNHRVLHYKYMEICICNTTKQQNQWVLY